MGDTQQINLLPLLTTVPADRKPQTNRETAELNESEDHEDTRGLFAASLLGGAAVSYYLSFVVHLVGYGVATTIFVFFGRHLVDPEIPVTPLRASLDDFEHADDQPEFQEVLEISTGSASSESDIQRISNNLRAVQNGLIDTLPEEALPSLLAGNSDEDTGSEGFLFKLPESGLAVTKGSFTVWTEPERPDPGQRYFIIIEVRLPEKVKAYRISDLRGTVIGTDNYRQKIPYDARTPNSSFYTDETPVPKQITGSESIKVRDSKVQLAIRVPGAQRLVRDTIEISSRRLREKQTLELVFGARR